MIMDPTLKKVLVGAITGFIVAFGVDIHSWALSKEKYDWKLAIKRWIAGAIGGITAAFGLNSLPT